MPEPTSTPDEVTRLLEAWQRERPDLDVSPMAVLSRVTRLARHLDRARSTAFATHGLESWEFDVLAALRRAGPPYELSPSSLLNQTMVTSGTMTARVDKLVRRGLVRRQPSPADRRAILVVLTTSGRNRVDAALEDLLEHEKRLLSGIADDERAQLAELLKRLVRPFDDAAG